MHHKNISLNLALFSLLILVFIGFMVSDADAADSQISPSGLEWLEFVCPEGDWSDLQDDVIILKAEDGGYYLVSKNLRLLIPARQQHLRQPWLEAW